MAFANVQHLMVDLAEGTELELVTEFLQLFLQLTFFVIIISGALQTFCFIKFILVCDLVSGKFYGEI